MQNTTTQSVEITLIDADTEHSDKLPVKIAASPHGVSIYAEGHGDFGSAEGYGTPVFLELHRGRLRLLVWADINREDPTHDIDLSGAREDRPQSDAE
jgi:hypothetical protein